MRTALVAALLSLTFGWCGQGEEPKLRMTLVGHRGAVHAVAFSPFKGVLASASEDGTVKLWDLSTGKNTRTFVLPSPVLSVAFGEYGLRLIAGCRDGTVKVWNLITGKNTATIHTDLPVRDVRFSSDLLDLCVGENHVWVACLAKDKPIDGYEFWDLNTGKQIPTASLGCPVVNLDVSTANENGQATANEWGVVSTGEIVFDTWTRCAPKKSVVLRGHTGRVTSLAFSPRDGHWLASGSLDKTIRIWDPDTGTCMMILSEHTGAVHCLRFSRDGKTLVSGSADATIQVWDMPGRP